MSTLLISFICACWPNIRTLPLIYDRQSLAFRIGLFFGVLEMVLRFSVPIFLCLYGLYYLVAVRFVLSELCVLKSMLAFYF